MKNKIFLAITLLTLTISASAQKKIEVTELPQPAQDFLKKHFSHTTVEKAKKDAEHGEKGFEVILKDGTEVEFWKDGSYREVDGEGKPIPTDFIPDNIKAYVAKNHPNEKITHIDYGHKDLDVDLTNKIDLEFTKDGKILKDKKDK
ncbi:Putative beta-lactamase-inhibitor-like, PepSY-like [Flavobacterium sp. CF108]|uniref:PepSY-like domain-containing protein n=1 Tax=unclassified Flavobacterium TaxID=196869 RepID=UPI0008B5E43C|nr:MULTISPECIES: PepSY-like domain-containing protein [unclassified Flavobacterium]SEO98950.1 Putative beta-lactamase-inhibitor-like, PepSY-like [Flavobacterium sp. fv08]SHH79492.1 Putative beta-lactamase-inhibitor-like, PepSY-like [Flavobacterium sp. CF108]